MISKINKRTAGIGIALTNSFIIVIELFVILKIMPFNIIGGGRAANYEAACITAIISIIILLIETMIVLVASEIIRSNRFKRAIQVFLWVYFASLCLNILGNLLGVTIFEKVVMTLACLINILFVLRLVLGKDTNPEI